MNSNTQPSEIARETIRQLAARKLAPTPDNYTRLYEELGGEGVVAHHPAVRALEQFATECEGREGEAGEKGRELVRSLAARNWNAVSQSLGALHRAVPAARARSAAWPELIRETLRQWDRRQAGLTVAKKRENLEHILGAFGADGERLHDKLSGLVRSWRERSDEPAFDAENGPPQLGPNLRPNAASGFPAASAPPAATAVADTGPGLRQQVAQTLEYAVVARLGYTPVLQEEARELAAMARRAASAAEIEDFGARLKRFFLRLELAGEDIGELFRGLLGLLRLLTDNLADLVGDDRWMKGQVATVQALLAEPLGTEMLRQAERGFRDLVMKQGTRKVGLDQAKAALKDMVSMFVDRLAAVSSSTGEFHGRMEGYAQRIAATEDIGQLGGLVEELVGHTRGMQADMMRAHEELVVARRKVSEYEARIQQLEQELESVSGQVREDQLTKTLNRRGLEEAWTAESARAERQETPLCLAVLDIDNFKLLNDRLGHQAGDRALVHLTGVVRQALRPSDIIARYGGEEFVVLLPHTPADEAVNVMSRLQRELTRHFFMHNNERVLITFSAGVAERRGNEARDELIKRADAALYEAKRAGKNRVVAAA
ncbi:MAG: GGDEF domain-containing protein [Betaproteobacteria bacterium]|nr:GGDEF domain-containing protein [Betaproteobacteria bacterium]